MADPRYSASISQGATVGSTNIIEVVPATGVPIYVLGVMDGVAITHTYPVFLFQSSATVITSGSTALTPAQIGGSAARASTVTCRRGVSTTAIPAAALLIPCMGVTVQFNEPLVIEPGNVLVVAGGQANTATQLCVLWKESR